MEPILTLQNASAYGPDGRALLPPTDLTVLPGERVRVTTEMPRFEVLARVAGGLRRPDDGDVILGGSVGYMPPEPGFWEDMTVLDNAALPFMAAGIAKRDRRAAALAALERLGLGYAAHTYPRSLSLCERRLAALARALVRAPELIILAGPTSMLDEKETDRFVSALAACWEEDRFAVLFCGSEAIPADKTINI